MCVNHIYYMSYIDHCNRIKNSTFAVALAFDQTAPAYNTAVIFRQIEKQNSSGIYSAYLLYAIHSTLLWGFHRF